MRVVPKVLVDGSKSLPLLLHFLAVMYTSISIGRRPTPFFMLLLNGAHCSAALESTLCVTIKLLSMHSLIAPSGVKPFQSFNSFSLLPLWMTLNYQHAGCLRRRTGLLMPYHASNSMRLLTLTCRCPPTNRRTLSISYASSSPPSFPRTCPIYTRNLCHRLDQVSTVHAPPPIPNPPGQVRSVSQLDRTLI